MIIDGYNDVGDCEKCGSIHPLDEAMLHSLRIRGPKAYKILLICRQIYQEARRILASSLEVHVGLKYLPALEYYLRRH